MAFITQFLSADFDEKDAKLVEYRTGARKLDIELRTPEEAPQSFSNKAAAARGITPIS